MRWCLALAEGSFTQKSIFDSFLKSFDGVFNSAAVLSLEEHSGLDFT